MITSALASPPLWCSGVGEVTQALSVERIGLEACRRGTLWQSKELEGAPSKRSSKKRSWNTWAVQTIRVDDQIDPEWLLLPMGPQLWWLDLQWPGLTASPRPSTNSVSQKVQEELSLLIAKIAERLLSLKATSKRFPDPQSFGFHLPSPVRVGRVFINWSVFFSFLSSIGLVMLQLSYGGSHPFKPTATLPAVDTAPPMAKPTAKSIETTQPIKRKRGRPVKNGAIKRAKKNWAWFLWRISSVLAGPPLQPTRYPTGPRTLPFSYCPGESWSFGSDISS